MGEVNHKIVGMKETFVGWSQMLASSIRSLINDDIGGVHAEDETQKC
jgi:hypothetical protein